MAQSWRLMGWQPALVTTVLRKGQRQPWYMRLLRLHPASPVWEQPSAKVPMMPGWAHGGQILLSQVSRTSADGAECVSYNGIWF